MKILKFFLLATTFIALSACSNDDDQNVVELTNSNIAGTYTVEFLEGTDTEVNDSSGVVISTTTFTTDTFTDATFTFTEGGTYSSTGSFRITFNTTVTGETPQTESEIQNFEDNMLAYSTDNTNRTLTLDGIVGNVTLFDGTNLYFTTEDTETFQGNTTTFVENFRLRRVQ